MAEVFLCKTGMLTAASKRELKKAGVVVVEVEDPAACQFIRASAPVSSDDMLWAACEALKTTYTNDPYNVAKSHQAKFASKMFELVDAAHSARIGATDAT